MRDHATDPHYRYSFVLWSRGNPRDGWRIEAIATSERCEEIAENLGTGRETVVLPPGETPERWRQ